MMTAYKNNILKKLLIHSVFQENAKLNLQMNYYIKYTKQWKEMSRTLMKQSIVLGILSTLKNQIYKSMF